MGNRSRAGSLRMYSYNSRGRITRGLCTRYTAAGSRRLLLHPQSVRGRWLSENGIHMSLVGHTHPDLISSSEGPSLTTPFSHAPAVLARASRRRGDFHRRPPFFGALFLDRDTSKSDSALQSAQSTSIFTVAQISPMPQGFCSNAAEEQKAANTVLVCPQGCACAYPNRGVHPVSDWPRGRERRNRRYLT